MQALWEAQNGQQGGDAARLAQALLTIAGADAIGIAEQVPVRRQVRPPPHTDVADPGDFVQVERRMLGLEVLDEATSITCAAS
jgi:hypothetical protein